MKKAKQDLVLAVGAGAALVVVSMAICVPLLVNIILSAKEV